MKRNVECVKSFRMRSPQAPVGKQGHPKHRAVGRAGLSLELLAKIDGPAQVLRCSLNALETRIVDDLEFIVIDERLGQGGKVQKHCPQQKYKVWNEAAGLLHGRYYVKVRRGNVDHRRAVY